MQFTNMLKLIRENKQTNKQKEKTNLEMMTGSEIKLEQKVQETVIIMPFLKPQCMRW